MTNDTPDKVAGQRSSLAEPFDIDPSTGTQIERRDSMLVTQDMPALDFSDHTRITVPPAAIAPVEFEDDEPEILPATVQANTQERLASVVPFPTLSRRPAREPTGLEDVVKANVTELPTARRVPTADEIQQTRLESRELFYGSLRKAISELKKAIITRADEYTIAQLINELAPLLDDLTNRVLPDVESDLFHAAITKLTDAHDNWMQWAKPQDVTYREKEGKMRVMRNEDTGAAYAIRLKTGTFDDRGSNLMLLTTYTKNKVPGFRATVRDTREEESESVELVNLERQSLGNASVQPAQIGFIASHFLSLATTLDTLLKDRLQEEDTEGSQQA